MTTGNGNDAVRLYREWWEVARRIRSDADRGRYLMAILDYAFEGTVPEDEQLDILTMQARMYIDRQRQAYAELQAKRQAIGRLGGLQTQANATKRKQMQANATKTDQNQAQYNTTQYNTIQVSKEKDIPIGISKKKAQQAAPRAGGLSSVFKEITTDAKHPAPPEEEEKNSAQKEEDPPVVAVEVVTTRTRAQPVQRFIPPTVEEVAAYCRQRQNGIDAEEFVAAYAQSGWRLKGGIPMKDWHAAVITWEKYRKRNKTIRHENGRSYDNDKGVRDAEFARYWAGRVGNQPV